MNKALYVIGTGLIVSCGVATIFLWRNKGKKCDVCHGCDKSEKEQSTVSEEALIKVVPTPEESEDEDVKNSAIESIYCRHKGAATVIRKSIETIRENLKISESTDSEIDRISAELEKMLSED